MTAFDREKIRAAIHHSKDGLHQALLDIGYDEWEKHSNWKIEDMLAYVSTYGEVVELAVLLGKFNQQVNNGGLDQYLFNGYGGSPRASEEYDSNVPLTRRLEKLMEKYKLNTTFHGAVVADCVKDFINRTYWNGPCDGELSFDDLDDAYYLINEAWISDMERYLKLWMEHNEDPIVTNRF